jgi:hypothetical protein
MHRGGQELGPAEKYLILTVFLNSVKKAPLTLWLIYFTPKKATSIAVLKYD